MASERVLESLANRLPDQDSIIKNNGDNLAEPDTYVLSMHKKTKTQRKQQYRTFTDTGLKFGSKALEMVDKLCIFQHKRILYRGIKLAIHEAIEIMKKYRLQLKV